MPEPRKKCRKQIFLQETYSRWAAEEILKCIQSSQRAMFDLSKPPSFVSEEFIADRAITSSNKNRTPSAVTPTMALHTTPALRTLVGFVRSSGWLDNLRPLWAVFYFWKEKHMSKFELGRTVVTKGVSRRMEEHPDFRSFVNNSINRYSKLTAFDKSNFFTFFLLSLKCFNIRLGTKQWLRICPILLWSIYQETYQENGEELSKADVVRTAWKCYIPAAVTGTVSIVCLIGSLINRWFSSFSAFLILSMSERKYLPETAS
mgnify:CR=1 FL=1